MHAITVTCKYEKDPIKTAEKNWQLVFPIIILWGFFSNAKGQLTPQSVVGSGRILNCSKLSCMSTLPASMKSIA